MNKELLITLTGLVFSIIIIIVWLFIATSSTNTNNREIGNCQDLMYFNKDMITTKSKVYCDKVLKEADIRNKAKRKLQKFIDGIEE